MAIQRTLALIALAATCASAHATEVYGGVGLPGATLGLRMDMGANISVRAEYAGGISADRGGDTAGVNYDARVRMGRAAVLADWHPFESSGFRVSGGLSFSKTNGTFAARGGFQSINGKNVDLTGRVFRVDLKFPTTAPYLGIGWSTRSTEPGWGFYADVGLQFGKFNTTLTQNVVGLGGITQADVDAEMSQFQDKVNKLSVLPNFSAGATYRF